MKVYCLLHNADYEGSSLYGVFSSIDAAKNWAKKEFGLKNEFNTYNVARDSACTDFSIEEYEVKD